jgi:hypothetical protein
MKTAIKCLLVALLVSACASRPRPHHVDRWSLQIRIGMTQEEVISAFNKEKPQVRRFSRADMVEVFRLTESAPVDLPLRVQDGLEMWIFDHKITSVTSRAIYVFLDPSKKVIGWAKQHTPFSEERYLHEPSAVFLKQSSPHRSIYKDEVKKIIGEPTERTVFPSRVDMSLLADTYWSGNVFPSAAGLEMWVHRKDLPGGQQRNVYTIWEHSALVYWDTTMPAKRRSNIRSANRQTELVGL